jgi:hypothetical protein
MTEQYKRYVIALGLYRPLLPADPIYVAVVQCLSVYEPLHLVSIVLLG